LKEGKEKFVENVTLLRKHGAATVVMAFDEISQAATEEDKVCKRSYAILVDEVRFPLEDIIFDPNVLTIGTGMEERANYGVDFMNATEEIKEVCPYVKISGGISNLSFGFRGVMKIHESIHAVFLYHCILDHGMDVGIVNAEEMLALDDLIDDMKELCYNLVYIKTAEATDDMLTRTVYERACTDTRKKKLPIPRQPRGRIVNKPRKNFAYDDVKPMKATEPLLPMSDATRNHVPNSYRYSGDTIEMITAIRARVSNPTKNFNVDYAQTNEVVGVSLGGIFQTSKSNAKKIKQEEVNVLFKDVAGCQEAKKEIVEFVVFYKMRRALPN